MIKVSDNAAPALHVAHVHSVLDKVSMVICKFNYGCVYMV